MIHRIDGPISLYRGTDRHLDDEIFELNARFASVTVIQSLWTLTKLLEMGYKPVDPVVIGNAVEPEFFYPQDRMEPLSGRKIRLISTSWSDNPRKGGPVYRWIEEHLDWDRFEYTFVGKSSEKFSRIRQIAPVHSRELGEILRGHDIYITASQNDPCSNALIEALSCGLPALFLDSGGHKEIVGYGGLSFSNKEEALSRLDVLARDHQMFRQVISVPSISMIAEKYLALAYSMAKK
jgi:glycosyltransferase involved in cell wall biosynthesis